MTKGCFHCMRILVILFNLLFVLVGCFILGCAIFFYVDATVKAIKDNMEEKKLLVDVILFTAIGIGGITIIVSTFGCCGAYHESECLLGTYFFCLFIIVAAEVAAGVVGYLKVDEQAARTTFNDALKANIDTYMTSPNDAEAPAALVRMQRWLSCCGGTGYKDYLKAGASASVASLFNSNDPPLVKMRNACAPDRDSGAGAAANLMSSLNPLTMPGCTERVFDLWAKNKIYVLIGFLVVAAIELLSMIIAMSLCCTVRRMDSGYIGVST